MYLIVPVRAWLPKAMILGIGREGLVRIYCDVEKIRNRRDKLGTKWWASMMVMMMMMFWVFLILLVAERV